MAAPHIPEEILIEIFSRSHTKSVGACRCLSKFWNNYLSSQEFIKGHLSRRSHQHQENLILISQSHALHLITPPIDEEVISKKVELLYPATRDGTVSQPFESRNKWNWFVGSCNGLVLLLNVADEMCVVNPITLQQVIIPDSPYEASLFRVPGCGFGYDSSNDDYKIVIFYAGETGTLVLVYSLKKKLWTEFDVSLYVYDNLPMCSCPYVNGWGIHWLGIITVPAYRYRIVIAAFYFADEVFVEVPLPPWDGQKKYMGFSLFVHRGCLCVSRSQSNGIIELWIMKEYGLGTSWTKLIVDNGDWDVVDRIPLCFTKNEECVLTTSKMSFGSLGFNHSYFHLKEGTMKPILVDGSRCIFSGGIFEDSLVSLN